MKAKHEKSIRVTGGGAYLRPIGLSKTKFKDPKKSTSRKRRLLRLHEQCSLAANRGFTGVRFLEWVQAETSYPQAEIMAYLSDHFPVVWSQIRMETPQPSRKN